MSTKVRNQPLPPKEESNFRLLVRLYESKQYKKGLKTADLVLKKFPDHGETLAMKGLICNCMDKKTEAYELVRAALKNDLKSYVCWHVYGILYRSDRVYDQAAKCYLNALRWDSENLQIFRDLSHLQMQLRDIPGLVETSSSILGIKSNNRQNWVQLTIAHHLNKNYEVAVQVLDTYLDTVDFKHVTDMAERYEMGEIQMYKATILFEAGHYKAVQDLLSKNDKLIRDRFGMLEMQAEIFLKINEFDKAEAIYRKLLSSHPDNYDYHAALRKTLEATPDKPSLPDVYAELAQLHPESSACKRLPLDFLDVAPFTVAAEAQVRRFVCRGIPSLFADLKPLLSNPEKATALWDIYTRLKASFEPDAEPQVWLQLYAAQHAAEVGDMATAISTIEDALVHEQRAPALIDLYSAKANILAAAGDASGAAAASDVARKLDVDDRFVNSMAVKFLFRAGRIADAEKTAFLFAKDQDATGSNLFDMQVMWYEVESANAHFNKGDLGMALKMCSNVVTHFADFREDQFDFHSYCLRKVTLRAYLDLLRMEDTLYGNEVFGEAATITIACYLKLHDHPPGLPAKLLEEKKMSEMSESAKTKYLARKKKEHDKKLRLDAERLEKDKAVAKASKKGSKFDDDPKGIKMTETEKPLEEADTLLTILKECAPHRASTQTAAFEVAVRHNRPLLALQAVKRMRADHTDSPELHSMIVRLSALVATRSDTVGHVVVRAVLADELKALTGNKTAEELNAEYTKALTPSSPLLCRLSAAQATLVISSKGADEAAALFTASQLDLSTSPHTVGDCTTVYKWLLESAGDDAANAFKAIAREHHQWSEFFEGQLRLPLPGANLVAELKQLKIAAAQ